MIDRELHIKLQKIAHKADVWLWVLHSQMSGKCNSVGGGEIKQANFKIKNNIRKLPKILFQRVGTIKIYIQ